jgi:hypothetical protein
VKKCAPSTHNARQIGYDNMDMDTNEIKIKTRHEQRQVGQVVSVTALTPTGRILGVVELQIPLLPGFPLAERIGTDAEKEILQIAEQLARRIAVGVQTEPVKSA